MTDDISKKRAMAHRRLVKASQTLMGLCSGLIADGMVHEREVLFLRSWLAENPEVTSVWPGLSIAKRVSEIVADGVITTEERDGLLELLQSITSEHFNETGYAQPEGPAELFDDDPCIVYPGRTFGFTGKFFFGTRAACERAVEKRGASTDDSVSKKIDYLIVGGMVSPDWITSSYGLKLQKAKQLQDSGHEIVITSERLWTACMADSGRL